MDLFKAEEKTRTFWEMTRDGVREAADLVIELLQTGAELASFGAVVKRRMNLTGDTVPDAMARDYADALDAVAEERLRIKEMVEEGSSFRLCVVDQNDSPAVRGGKPFGFALRGSASGRLDEQVQAHMTVSKLQRIAERREQAGLLSAEEKNQAIGRVREMLLPAGEA